MDCEIGKTCCIIADNFENVTHWNNIPSGNRIIARSFSQKSDQVWFTQEKSCLLITTFFCLIHRTILALDFLGIANEILTWRIFLSVFSSSTGSQPGAHFLFCLLLCVLAETRRRWETVHVWRMWQSVIIGNFNGFWVTQRRSRYMYIAIGGWINSQNSGKETKFPYPCSHFHS